MPTIAVVGRGIADADHPDVEVKDRATGERVDVPQGEVVDHLRAVCGA